jgi:hypothetical protein
MGFSMNVTKLKPNLEGLVFALKMNPFPQYGEMIAYGAGKRIEYTLKKVPGF